MDKEKLKHQRDRFLAFSFATSDLLLEINKDGIIDFVTGATKGLTGADESFFKGKKWLDLFERTDQTTLIALHANAKPGKRCGPILVQLTDQLSENAKDSHAVLSGIKMPDSESFFITLSFSNILMTKTAAKNRRAEDTRLLGKDEFLEAAKDVLSMAKSFDQDAELTMLDIADPKKISKEMGEEQWNDLKEELAALLQSKSIDGETAAEIAEGKFSFIHDSKISLDAVKERLSEIAQEKNPAIDAVEFRSKTVETDLSTLSDKETSKALFYTMSEFEKKGTDLTIETLGSSFQAYVTANAHKMAEFKEIVFSQQFMMNFQPIVDLHTGEASHYEMLARFKDGTPPFEWICFAEDVGMIEDFDMAVFERALNYIIYKASTNRSKFAVNISGRSIQDKAFFEKLISKAKKHEDISNRILIEITESTAIDDMDEVSGYLKKLQDHGFKCCLDDFGAGSASFQYLHKFDVDYVKIDGIYVKKLLESQRDQSMVKNLTQMCKDLGIKVIAEFVETQKHVDKLKSFGVDYGQGYFFSKPLPEPYYEPTDKKSVKA